MSAFIRMIRRRDQAFAAFARDLKASLAAEAKEQPELAASVAELQKSLAAIDETAEQELPSVALETVQQWTDEMKKAADEVRPDNRQDVWQAGGAVPLGRRHARRSGP